MKSVNQSLATVFDSLNAHRISNNQTAINKIWREAQESVNPFIQDVVQDIVTAISVQNTKIVSPELLEDITQMVQLELLEDITNKSRTIESFSSNIQKISSLKSRLLPKIITRLSRSEPVYLEPSTIKMLPNDIFVCPPSPPLVADRVTRLQELLTQENDTLPPALQITQNREVLIAYYGLEDGVKRTYEEVEKLLKISTTGRVSRIINKLKPILKELLR